MLNLKLRDEFLGSQMPGTAIALRDSDKKGYPHLVRCDFYLHLA